MSDLQKEAQRLESSLFLQNLVKLIPVEIIALFAVIKGLIPETASEVSVWIVFVILFVLVPFYVIFAMKVKKWDQIILMTLAFPIWTFAIGGVPGTLGIAWFEPWMMSVLLALFTLIPPMFYGQRLVEEYDEEDGEDYDGEVELSTSSKFFSEKPWRQVN